MNKYRELKERHQKEVNEFPMFFAFSNKQFEEGKAKLGITDNSELIDIGYGGFIRGSDKQAYIDMHKRFEIEHKESMKDEEYCYHMFRYELGNHEYCITRDFEDTFSACGLTEEEVTTNPMLMSALGRARQDYLRGC